MLEHANIVQQIVVAVKVNASTLVNFAVHADGDVGLDEKSIFIDCDLGDY